MARIMCLVTFLHISYMGLLNAAIYCRCSLGSTFHTPCQPNSRLEWQNGLAGAQELREKQIADSVCDDPEDLLWHGITTLWSGTMSTKVIGITF